MLEQSIFVQTTERWAQLDSWARQIAAAAIFSQLPLEQSADLVDFASWSKIKGSLSVKLRTPELRVSSSHLSYHGTRAAQLLDTRRQFSGLGVIWLCVSILHDLEGVFKQVVELIPRKMCVTSANGEKKVSIELSCR
jgi:hypothetical protein